MNINQNLKNILSLFSFEIITRLLGFAAVTYLARVLGTEGFGVINIGLAVLTYGIIFSSGGLNLIGTRKIAGGVEEPGKYTGDILFSRLLLSVIIYLVAAVVVFVFVESEEALKVILVYNLFLIPSAFLLEWFFQGYQKMDIIALGRIAGVTAYLIFILIFVNEAGDILLTPVGWVLNGIVNAFLLFYFFFKHKYPLKFRFKDFRFLPLFKESLPLATGNAITQFVMMFPVIYIGIVLTESDAGLYSAAYKLVVLFLTLDRVFNKVFFPKIIKCVKETPEKLNDIFNKILKIISTVTFISALFMVILSEFFIKIIFGGNFAGANPIFQVLTGLFVFSLINTVFTYTLIAMNREKIYIASLFIGMVVFLIAVVLLTPAEGSHGTALALVLFEFVSLIIMAIKLKASITFNLLRTLFLPAVLVFAVVYGFVSLNIGLIPQLLIAIFAGSPVIALVCGFTFSEIKFIKRIFT